MKPYDVVVIGAGIIGLSIAWQLSRRSSLRIAVVEKGAGLGEGSTGASSAICRHRYSRDDMVLLAQSGIGAYRNWGDYTGLSETCAQFHEDGVLWMPGSDHNWADTEHARMQSLGVATAVLDDIELKARFPALSTCSRKPDLATGETHDCVGGGRHLLETEGGYFDPALALQDLRAACTHRGIDVLTNSAVTAIEQAGGTLRSVTINNSEALACAMAVNAAGPWCQQVMQLAGLQYAMNLQPVRIQVLYLDRPTTLGGHIPVTVDMASGVYFRTQNRGQQLVVSSVVEEDEREVVADPDNFLREVDSTFQDEKLHLLHHRLPGMPYHGTIRGYCGLYTTNLDDVHPVLGETDLHGFWLANGFSGHGFKLAPAIGALLAGAMTGTTLTADPQVPIATFHPQRERIKLDSKSVLA